MLVIGFDVGGTNVRGVALRPGETEPLAIRRSRTRPDGDVLVDTICEVSRLLSDDIGEPIDADSMELVFVDRTDVVNLGEPMDAEIN